MIRFDKLAEAAALLGISEPITVVVERLGDLEDGSGFYCREDGGHLIALGMHLDAAEASRTLWHELTHAAQCEHWFDGDGMMFAEAALDGSYPNSLIEDGAAAAESFHDQLYPLTEGS